MSATSRSLVVGGVALALAAAPLGAASASAVPSTTSVTLSAGTSAFGQTVTATAAVATSAGPATGDVYFSVDGVAWKANLGASGTATMVLPDAAVGAHQVTAMFVPQFSDQQQASSSPVTPWTVEQVRTRLAVRVIGRGARIPTSVRVQADGDYGSRPTGSVRLALRRAGSHRASASVQQLPADGVVTARLGRLRKGSYRLAVTYRGDAEHRREKRVQWFRVVKR